MPFREVPGSPIAGSERDGKALRVRLGRCAVLGNSLALRDGLLEELQRPPPPALVLLDLSRLERLDTAGVAAIVECLVAARRMGAKLALENVRAQGTRMLELFHLGPLLHTESEGSGPGTEREP